MQGDIFLTWWPIKYILIYFTHLNPYRHEAEGEPKVTDLNRCISFTEMVLDMTQNEHWFTLLLMLQFQM